MKKHHALGVVVAIVAFIGIAFYATPTGDDDEIHDQITEVLRTIVTLERDRIIVTVEEDFVRLDGTVESEEQITEIIEAVEPITGDRELLHELDVAPVDDGSGIHGS